MNRQEGIKQIDEAQWKGYDGYCLGLHVETSDNRPVHAWLALRPVYCDRGHIQLIIDGPLDLDSADSFPRYFFSFDEANWHTRTFLKWRLWKERVHSDAEMRSAFEGPILVRIERGIEDGPTGTDGAA